MQSSCLCLQVQVWCLVLSNTLSFKPCGKLSTDKEPRPKRPRTCREGAVPEWRQLCPGPKPTLLSASLLPALLCSLLLLSASHP